MKVNGNSNSDSSFISYHYLNMLSRRFFLKNTAHIVAATSSARLLGAPLNLPVFSHSTGQQPDWALIREAFPLKKTRAYFNTGTLGPSPQIVLDTVFEAMKNVEVTGEMDHSIVEARQSIAQFVKADATEIALTKNTTEGINIIAWGLLFKKNDEIIISNHEHVGNATPWLHLAQVKSLKLQVIELGKSSDETLANIRKKISDKTRLIVMPHITCTTGQIQPIQEIVELGKQKGILVFIDGAHGAGMLNLDLPKLGCDFYATCCHKWMLAPKGTGFLYIKKEALNSVQPHFIGAGAHASWELSPQKVTLPDFIPSAERFDYGTYNATLWQGVKAAIDFLESIGMDHIETRIKELNHYLQSGLEELTPKEVSILTPLEDNIRSGMLGIKFINKDTQTFNASVGTYFRVRFVPEHQLNSIRISTHIFNTEKEIDDFMAYLKKYLAK